MPITIGNYTYTAVDGGITINYLKTPWRTSKPRKQYPVDGYTNIYFIEEEYLVLIDYYQPLQPSAKHPTEASTFWVKDSDLTDVGTGVGKFLRTWALLPGSSDKGYVRTEYQSTNIQIPAIDTSQDLFYQFPVASYVVSNGKHVITVTTGAAPFNVLDISAGKPAAIRYNVVDPKNGTTQTRTLITSAIAVTSNTITITQIKDVGISAIISVQRADVNQPAYTKTVMSRMEYDYWIVGVNCTSIESIPIIEQLQIIENETGARTETLTDTSTPSIDDWYAAIAAGKWYCQTSSNVKRWVGNIFERETIYVRYQV